MPATAPRTVDPAPSRFRNQRFGKDISNRMPKQATFRQDSFDPVVNKRNSKGVSPFLFLLLVLGGVVAFFGAGNLQQINTWGDSLAAWLHQNNDSLVGSILGSGNMILAILGGVFVVFMFMLWRNSVRRRASDN